MRKWSCISIFLVCLFPMSAGAGSFKPSLVGASETLIGLASYGASDISSQSKAKNRVAKKRAFCPPGQAKKAGKGSAFNC